MKTILELSHTETKKYLLKNESYFNFDLPQYFKFHRLLKKISATIEGKPLSSFYKHYTDKKTQKQRTLFPSNYEKVNYRFLNNKDGKFAWRPFQLIHPALYVSLVHEITKEENWDFIVTRFKEFRQNPKIRCFSIPLKSEDELSDKATTVTNWWQSVEQKSVELALDYEYILHTDIADCYGSIYTHSIAWALHTKVKAKSGRSNNKLIGNVIDKHLQSMSFGQTNGIPQGSVLMDLIAELVLGYSDLKLSSKLEKTSIDDYQIIRYRDDYRVFTNNPQDAELILKNITEVLIDLNMRLNAQKTFVSDNVIQGSIKPDKLYWNLSKRGTKSLQNHLFLIHSLSQKFPNSGSLSKALTKYFDRITNLKETYENINVLISILVDITFNNPRTYPISSAILSEMLLFFDQKERDAILEKISNKFDKIPNIGHLQIWLQRVTIKFDRERVFSETLCKKVNDSKIDIWESKWLTTSLRNLISKEVIVDENTIKNMGQVIEPTEVKLFKSKSGYKY